ncbi:MAG TPA: 4-(cytidine 5'-diphospho)-2-C-methyl-D-erythritol kinase [Alphaproteobacteria bacterium]|jgi:4-diphosphocytidyl-2-C-methyl-D-erythritol kinase
MIAVAAPAKVNLTLHVLGRRADGYHRLDSLVAFASLHDVLRAEDAAGLTLDLAGPGAEALADDLARTPSRENLVLRAARALAEAAGIADPAAALGLYKTLPVAGGIGGGSADAAAALIALARLWRLDLTDAAMADIALPLGADLPVCLASRPTMMSGIGERLTPAPALPPLGLLLVNPRVALPTAAVFQALDGHFGAETRLAYQANDAPSLLAALRAGRNDLEAPARRLAPVVGEVLAALERLPGARLARMSGSGATCFALFDDASAAEAAARVLRAGHESWWIAAGRLIADRAEISV